MEKKKDFAFKWVNTRKWKVLVNKKEINLWRCSTSRRIKVYSFHYAYFFLEVAQIVFYPYEMKIAYQCLVHNSSSSDGCVV